MFKVAKIRGKFCIIGIDLKPRGISFHGYFHCLPPQALQIYRVYIP